METTPQPPKSNFPILINSTYNEEKAENYIHTISDYILTVSEKDWEYHFGLRHPDWEQNKEEREKVFSQIIGSLVHTTKYGYEKPGIYDKSLAILTDIFNHEKTPPEHIEHLLYGLASNNVFGDLEYILSLDCIKYNRRGINPEFTIKDSQGRQRTLLDGALENGYFSNFEILIKTFPTLIHLKSDPLSYMRTRNTDRSNYLATVLECIPKYYTPQQYIVSDKVAYDILWMVRYFSEPDNKLIELLLNFHNMNWNSSNINTFTKMCLNSIECDEFFCREESLWIILSKCEGTIINFNELFDVWCKSQNFIINFNTLFDAWCKSQKFINESKFQEIEALEEIKIDILCERYKGVIPKNTENAPNPDKLLRLMKRISASYFAVMKICSMEILQINQESSNKSHRFFSIALKLPPEIKLMICNAVAGLNTTYYKIAKNALSRDISKLLNLAFVIKE